MITLSNHNKKGINSAENEFNAATDSDSNKSTQQRPKYTHVAEVKESLTTQAEKIITKFGNPRKLADALTAVGYPINRTSIYRWNYSRENGGTGGLVPTAAWPFLISAARLEGVYLSPADTDPRETHEIHRRMKAKINTATGEVIPWVHWETKKAEARKTRSAERKKSKK